MQIFTVRNYLFLSKYFFSWDMSEQQDVLIKHGRDLLQARKWKKRLDLYQLNKTSLYHFSHLSI